jgi:hypothetical protein
MIKQGKKLKTMSIMKNILAEADVTEDFDKDFGIYDLNEFLTVLSLGNQADLDFSSDSHVTINGGNSKIKYFFSDPNVLVVPPEKFNEPECDVRFALSGSTIENVQKAASIMQLPDVIITPDNGKITIKVTDVKNPTSNDYTETLDTYDGPDFNFHLKTENLKMIPGDYDISASSQKNISNWSGLLASYWVAMEASV